MPHADRSEDLSYAPLQPRPRLSTSELDHLENETIEHFRSIEANASSGPWSPSPVIDRYLGVRQELLTTPGWLRRFRRTLLGGGRLNFPDSPHPKEHYLQWDNSLAGQTAAGSRVLAGHLLRLYRYQRFTLQQVSDTLVGDPTTFRVPRNWRETARSVGKRYFRRKHLQPDTFHITEAQIRYFYQRTRLEALFGRQIGDVLEIGGGFGGLAGELLQHLCIRRYFLVELPDSMALSFFYLRALFDCRIQILCRPDEQVDHQARIVIAAPWKLTDLPGPVDLTANFMSFQHMMPESVGFYLGQAARLASRNLFLLNRDYKRDPTDLPISEYPIPDEFQLLDRRPWIFGPHLEVAYRRKSSAIG